MRRKIIEIGAKKIEVPSKKQIIDIDVSSTNGNPYGAIGHDKTSRTRYPEVFLCKKTGLSYWDCPGFFDNRGTEERMAIAIANNLAIRASQNIKSLAFVIDRSALGL